VSTPDRRNGIRR